MAIKSCDVKRYKAIWTFNVFFGFFQSFKIYKNIMDFSPDQQIFLCGCVINEI